MVGSNGFRIEPTDGNGILLVNVESGGQYIYIPFEKIGNVINLLRGIEYE